MSRYVSRDGLCTSADPSAVALWDDICARQAERKSDWTTRLRDVGVKLAHPDDGWVHRDADPPYLNVSWYPQFNDNPQVGDLMALGCPPRDEHYRPAFSKTGVEYAFDGYRVVRVLDVKRNAPGGPIPWTELYFEDTGVRLPPAAPRLRRLTRWWRRGKPARNDGALRS